MIVDLERPPTKNNVSETVTNFQSKYASFEIFWLLI